MATPLKSHSPSTWRSPFLVWGASGAEHGFWDTDVVFATAVGYTDGATENPNYDEVCTGRTGHAEVVKVIFDPKKVGYVELLRIFWDHHDPTQGMRQGNDIGSQYRSCVFWLNESQKQEAEASRAAVQEALDAKDRGQSPLRSAWPNRSTMPMNTTSGIWLRKKTLFAQFFATQCTTKRC
ncbi:peptide-methionine (S)-S-oxide reductase MsrA [Microbulbifer sp. SSSA003]|uniref:peptide-methionine (S)-S-oxide reductase MsrA n=1 Tax=unclassified Microbulbifer TaxID=2619833 RepID=UPI00403AF434